MMDVFHIRNWSAHFENNKSRERESCRYVCMPNKQDGVGLTRILAEPDGLAIFGVWCLILQACSRQKKRDGWLTADGDPESPPWDIEDLALRWRCTPQAIQRALDIVCSHKIQWMEKIESKCPLDARPVSLNRREEKGKEEKGNAEPVARVDGGDEQIDQAATSQKGHVRTDDEIYRIACQHAQWRVKDPDTAQEHRATLVFLFRSHSELAKSIAEEYHLRVGKKMWAWELEDAIATQLEKAAIATPSKAKPVSPERAEAERLIAEHGWEKCRELSTVPVTAIKNASDMIHAMMTNPEIVRKVTEGTAVRA